METYKLVNAAQLNLDLTNIANAIRLKGGISDALQFPLEFIEKINNIPSSGGPLQQGSFILERSAKNFTITLNGPVSNMVFFDSVYPAGADGAGWHSIGGTFLNNFLLTIIRFNNANISISTAGNISINNNSIVISNLQYNILAGKNFYWYAW